MSRKAMFLDRDGVINVDTGYVYRISDFIFIDGIFQLTRAAISKGYLLFVITNQAGIGRGYYSEADFQMVTIWMLDVFESEGVHVEKVYFSPYHPVFGIGKYKKDHFSRKPHPGMLLEAKSQFDLDLSESMLIGDKISDIEAGNAAGIGVNLLFKADPCVDSLDCNNCHYISSLTQAQIYL